MFILNIYVVIVYLIWESFITKFDIKDLCSFSLLRFSPTPFKLCNRHITHIHIVQQYGALKFTYTQISFLLSSFMSTRWHLTGCFFLYLSFVWTFATYDNISEYFCDVSSVLLQGSFVIVHLAFGSVWERRIIIANVN